jgi:hypothetical protein
MSPSEFPGSPKLLKGALVVFETMAPVPTNLIAFQYNPDTLRRSFAAQTAVADPSPSSGRIDDHALPPTESFSLTVELDATDQLEQPDSNPVAIATGLHPVLSALELLLYPPSSEAILAKVLARAGAALIGPAKVPLVLLVWGPLRVVPVRVESVSIVEQAFDQRLNPIRAEVQLGLKTLTEGDLKQAGPPFDTLAMVQLIAKEGLARTNAVASVSDTGASLHF